MHPRRSGRGYFRTYTYPATAISGHWPCHICLGPLTKAANNLSAYSSESLALPLQVTFIEYTFRRFSIVQMSKSVAEAIVPMQVGDGERA